MDVLRPALININGRIYRRNTVKEEEYYEEEEDFSNMETPGKFNFVKKTEYTCFNSNHGNLLIYAF